MWVSRGSEFDGGCVGGGLLGDEIRKGNQNQILQRLKYSILKACFVFGNGGQLEGLFLGKAISLSSLSSTEIFENQPFKM